MDIVTITKPLLAFNSSCYCALVELDRFTSMKRLSSAKGKHQTNVFLKTWKKKSVDLHQNTHNKQNCLEVTDALLSHTVTELMNAGLLGKYSI